MLSKPIREHILTEPDGNDENEITNSFKSRKNLQNTYPILTYKQFYENSINLKKYKLPELKSIVVHYKLPRTGNKTILISRITSLFHFIKNAVIIQKKFRGWIVRYSFRLRGEALKNKSLCVNDTDFVTLEPLNEIENELFYSYIDDKGFTYGFNIMSLGQTMKTNHKIMNPYNREHINEKTINNIIALNNIILILYPEYKTDFFQINVGKSQSNIRRNLLNTSVITNLNLSVNANLSNEYLNPNIIAHLNNITINADLLMKYNKIMESRRKPLNVRIQELFMEIDQLGNYTQSSWFSNLERREYLRFFRCLSDIWYFRAQMSREVKNNICPIIDPFANIFALQTYYTEVSFDEIKLACVTVIENLIYTGVDDEHRKLGALHILSALTMVSIPARNAMSWLYESIAY